MFRLPRLMTVASMFVVAIVGCGKGSGLKVVPVTGKVTLEGQPVEGATVAFIQTGNAGQKTYASTGVTDAQGAYKLLTMDGKTPVDGVVPGQYMVTITKVAASQGGGVTGFQGKSQDEIAKMMKDMKPSDMGAQSKGVPTADLKGESEAQKAMEAKSALPAKYSNGAESGLTADVKASGAQTFDFPLTKGE